MNAIVDSNQLRVFVALARHTSMGKAAEELQMTVSGVSHCLKALETDLDCRLFDRNSRKFALSPSARELLPDAERILDQMIRLRSKAQAWNDWRKGQLIIGANGTACQFLLPPVLSEFRESFPDFTIRIEQCSSRQAASMLLENKLDLALLTEPVTRAAGVEFSVIGQDDLQFIVRSLHPWAVKRKARSEEIPNCPLILPERDGDTYDLIESYFRAKNIQIRPFLEIANEQAVVEFLRLDLGVGILPRWVVAEQIERGLLAALPLGRRRLKRRWGVLHARTRKLTLADDLFIKIARNVLRALIEPPNS
jgi:DNA-binding transcriptional LysR family regulator